jgi:uncharacterized phage protein gp47/JayE
MADYNYIDSTGTVVPDTGDILAQVQNEWLNAFGQDLILTANTPQGIMITAETLARVAIIKNNALLANQINPNLAGGVFQDAICALTGLKRDAQTYSQTPVNVAGVAGTVIPQGSTLQNTVTGELFESTADVTLASDGTGSVLFQAVNPGPVTALANTLTQIVSGPLGWETATNPNDATLGALSQSDLSLRTQRVNTLALQANGMDEAITSQLFNTPGVTSVAYRSNVKSIVQVIDGLSLNPHSMYACVDGGTDLDVATAIFNKKGGGCDYNNGFGTPVSVNITGSSGQIYTVLFDRPIYVPILVKVTVSVGNSIQDPTTAIQNAILSYANGTLNPDESGFVIGAAVSCFELAGAINQAVPSIYVHNVQTSLLSPINYSNAEIPITLYQRATITQSSITVVIQ